MRVRSALEVVADVLWQWRWASRLDRERNAEQAAAVVDALLEFLTEHADEWIDYHGATTTLGDVKNDPDGHKAARAIVDAALRHNV